MVVVASLAPTVAQATPERTGERVVHGRIGTPTGHGEEMPRRVGTVKTVHGRCIATAAGVADTGWVVEDVRAGRTFTLTADAGPWNDDFDIEFFESLAACEGATPGEGLPYDNRGGDEHAVVPVGARVALVTLVTGSPGAAFTYRELHDVRVQFAKRDQRRPTVVAVLELAEETNGFSPYHFDFAGHQHPWNNDDDLENDVDFSSDPGGWLPGYPGATPVDITVPTDPDTVVADLAAGDRQAWDGMKSSVGKDVNLYRFPGTKVVGAVRFGDSRSDPGTMYGDNAAHLTKSTSVAAGNLHGTCPECAVVVVLFDWPSNYRAALEWVAEQPWIDVVTNSWGLRTQTWGPTTFPDRVLRPAVESGQTWVWAAGNGVDGSLFAPGPTYTWGDHAADWVVTVGGAAPPDDNAAHGGRPVDIVSYSKLYASAGGVTASGVGQHDGTSNAAPVVAGTFARTVQLGRDLLGDSLPGHHDGLVGEGRPRPCDGPLDDCPLKDGKLERAEVQSLVFGNALPGSVRTSPALDTKSGIKVPDAARPSPPAAPGYTASGHGIVHGRWDPGRYTAEQRRLLDALRGATRGLPRPPGEYNWMFADSKCRQKLWGAWTGGYYQDGDPDPTWDVKTDQLAIALNAACTPLPSGAVASGGL